MELSKVNEQRRTALNSKGFQVDFNQVTQTEYSCRIRRGAADDHALAYNTTPDAAFEDAFNQAKDQILFKEWSTELSDIT